MQRPGAGPDAAGLLPTASDLIHRPGMTSWRAAGFSALFVLAGCSGASEPAPRAPAPASSASAAVAASRPPGTLYRDEVVGTVDQGLGSFLQRVEVEPALVDGNFVGHRITRLSAGEFWEGVDLQPGDVVTRINGMPIERDIDAYNAFMALKQAKELRVSYFRDDVLRELVFAIVERPQAAAPSR